MWINTHPWVHMYIVYEIKADRYMEIKMESHKMWVRDVCKF